MAKKKPVKEKDHEEEQQAQEKQGVKALEPDIHMDVQLLKQSVSGIYEEIASFCDELLQLRMRMEKVETQMQSIMNGTQSISRRNTKSKVRIKDKETGMVYPSQNNAYQSLLKQGALKELVDRNLFGSVPEKNNFGWFALVKAWPERFEEVEEPDDEESGESGESKESGKSEDSFQSDQA